MTRHSVDVEHIAREFPSPKDSRPARSLTYRCGGHIYQAVIGRQRMLCDAGRGADGPWTAAGSARRVSGNTVLSIVATEAAVEIWSREPTRGWPNPSLVAHDAVLHVDYLDGSDTIAN